MAPERRLDDRRGDAYLGWSMRPLEETLLDTAAALIEQHVVSEKTRR